MFHLHISGFQAMCNTVKIVYNISANVIGRKICYNLLRKLKNGKVVNKVMSRVKKRKTRDKRSQTEKHNTPLNDVFTSSY